VIKGGVPASAAKNSFHHFLNLTGFQNLSGLKDSQV
jgi:hypothetical protein